MHKIKIKKLFSNTSKKSGKILNAEELKNYYKGSKNSNKQSGLEFSRFFSSVMKSKLQLIYAFCFFAIIIFSILFIFDKFIIPSAVHDRPSVIVPNVEGLPLEKAQEVLEEHHLRWEVSYQQYSSKVEKGMIIKQKPLANQSVKSKRLVYLTVSKGQELVTTPGLTGIGLRTAKIILMNTGLNLGNISYIFSDYVAKDSIISQSVFAGQKIPYGENINLVVSKGPEFQVMVPKVIGMSYTSIEKYLAEQGFVLGTITYKKDETFAPGTIIEQFPLSGELAAQGSKIDLVVNTD